MFYSEALLNKTGPLARVWLASNHEKKITKQAVLQSDIDDNVRDIIGEGKAPMALRLKGQLLLGVVVIYGRKTKYLVDDCEEVVGRLRIAFRPGNVDLPANQHLLADPAALTLPDRITEQDLLAPLPDADWLGAAADINLNLQEGLDLGWDTSQLLPDTQLTPSSQRNRVTAGLEEDDLNLFQDFDDEPSIEIGRKATTPRADRPSLHLEDDLNLDLGFGDTTFGDNDVDMQDADAADKADRIAESNAAALIRADTHRADSEFGAQNETSFRLNGTAVEDIDETEVQAAQRVKRRKVLQQDYRTELANDQLKKQQQNRSAITKPATYLPNDPVLLGLMDMQRSGAFVSNILGDGRMSGLAPQLRGILSIEVVRKLGERKRKRDSGIADMERSSEHAPSSPQIELGDAGAHDFDTTVNDPIMGDDEIANIIDQGEDLPASPPPAFEETEMPLVHPSQSGPVSVGTKTAVAALRKHLAPGHRGTEPPTPSKRTRTEAKFTELCPKRTTSRTDATKMFFELLVLGTKDAVKIEQEKDSDLHGEIRVRGKRGLWGNWAEMGEALDTAAVAVEA